MTTEKWYSICGYAGYYEISDTGIVRSIPRVINILNGGKRKLTGKIIKPRPNNCGYLEVRLSMFGMLTTKFVHILLAEIFIPNPENKKEINHIDGNKLNNSIENLEWVTHAENIKHAYKLGLCKVENKQIPVVDICTGKEFKSVKQAAELNNIPYSTCKGYLNGFRKNKTCLRYLITSVLKVA